MIVYVASTSNVPAQQRKAKYHPVVEMEIGGVTRGGMNRATWEKLMAEGRKGAPSWACRMLSVSGHQGLFIPGMYLLL